MPQVIDETVPHEILIRYSEAGEVRAAEMRRRRRVTVDGEVVMDQILPAEALALGDFPTSAAMADVAAAALARLPLLEDEAKQLARNAAALEQERDSYKAQAEEMRGVAQARELVVVSLNAEIARLNDAVLAPAPEAVADAAAIEGDVK